MEKSALRQLKAILQNKKIILYFKHVYSHLLYWVIMECSKMLPFPFSSLQLPKVMMWNFQIFSCKFMLYLFHYQVHIKLYYHSWDS